MSHSHHHHHHHGDKQLSWAVAINIILTIAQIVGGVLAGSMALVADALHNLSDAGAIVIAIIARRIARKPASSTMSFGYKRAEIIGALINSSTLIVVGAYLIYEAITQFLEPKPVDGWIVVYIAAIALVIDAVTAWLTYKAGAKTNLNLKAAFVHNLSDAFASLVVIVSGSLIILYQWYLVDLIATIVISIYVIYHGIGFAKQSIVILMQGTSTEIDVDAVHQALLTLKNVKAVHHLHVWQLDDNTLHLEANIELTDQDLNLVKVMLKEEFAISHSTIETLLNEQSFDACYLPNTQK